MPAAYQLLSPKEHLSQLCRKLWALRCERWWIPLLLLFLISQALSQTASAFRGGSTLGAALHKLRYGLPEQTRHITYGFILPRTLALQFYKVGDVWYHYSLYAANPAEQRASDVVWVTFEPTVRFAGLWSPIAAHYDEGIAFDRTRHPLAKPLSNEDQRTLLEASLTYWERQPTSARRQRILSGDWQHTEVLWGGVANDASVLVAFAWLVRLIALHWRQSLLVPMQRLRQIRRRSRMLKNLCAHCGYPVKGLVRCPECGQEISINVGT